MHEAVIKTGVFEGAAARPRGERFVRRLLHFLALTDSDALDFNPGYPKLYDSGIRYARDPDWLDSHALLEYGVGDCKSLCAYRLAELHRSGEDPGARMIVTGGPNPGGGGQYHVRILRSGGWIEDPSRRKGM